MKHLVLFLGIVGVAGPSVFAARAPDDKSRSNYVVIGKVQKVYERKRGRLTDYMVQLRIQKITRGSGFKPSPIEEFQSGDLMHVSCYQRQRSLLPIADDLGHDAVPQEGQTIKAFVHRRSHQLLEGNFPDWFEPEMVESQVLKKELSQLINQTGKTTPDSKPKDLEEQFITDLRKADPNFLRTSPEAEAKWKIGQFNEEKAKARLKTALKFCEEFNVELPRLYKELWDEHQTTDLKGARLELTAQLFEALVAKTSAKLAN